MDITQLKFKGQWRPYQQRVLDGMKGHLVDNKLHIVAAPGSGKTVLGLEAMLRLGKPALILTPTITIREQWVARFIDFYLPDSEKKENWISNELNSLHFINVSTYQALHSAYHKIVNEEYSEDSIENEIIDFSKIELIQELKKNNIGTIVLDEAHHLRTEWWKSLSEVIKQLPHIQIISLTATPPYDSTKAEWDKYQELCGPIDAEIYVPELVKANNLCPHQDYVYMNYPTDKEVASIEQFKRDVEDFVDSLRKNQLFINAIKNHDFLIDPDLYTEEILNDPEYYTSLLVFLNNVHVFIPKQEIQILGHQKKIPTLNYFWIEILLNGFLFSIKESIKDGELIKAMIAQLSKIGCIEKRKVNLISNHQINKILINSLGKLNSIKEIVKSETFHLQENLRMVILTDFIRQDVLPKQLDDLKTINTIGVIPIFESLRRESLSNLLGVLSGAIIIIPTASVDLFNQLLVDYNIKIENVKITKLDHDDNYCDIKFIGQSNKQKVNIISTLFSRGGINVLIGTKSLLGEGWDEPSINTLILASFVGSYMLSNQMRGRAIRIDKKSPQKTANIWHLVCIDKESLYEEKFFKKMSLKLEDTTSDNNQNIHSEDFDTLKRRFKSFVGISYDGKVIENGLDRLNIIIPPYTLKHIEEINQKMLKLANNREGLSKEWFDILSKSDRYSQVTEEVKANKEFLPNPLIYFDKFALILAEVIVVLGIIFSYIGLGGLMHEKLNILVITLIVLFLIPTYKAGLLLYKYGSIKGRLHIIGKIILETLQYLDVIQQKGVKVISHAENKYQVSCSLSGATTYETYVFNECLEQFLNPIDNPRYLFVRKNIFNVFNQYYSIPEVIGINKTGALFFEKRWRKYIGHSELIYTRNTEGRKMLLKARVNSLSSILIDKVEKKRVWRSKWS